jgi:nucleoid-associated protein YgaU
MAPTAATAADRRLSAAAKVDDRVGRAGFTTPWGPAQDEEVYIVRAGETLRTIARDRLGDARRAGEILEWNRDSLGDSARLTPGQAIFLPAGARR